MNNRRDAIFYFFLFVMFASITFMFYASPLRSKVEDYFYDMRVRMQIGVQNVPNITLVTIDEATIAKVEGENALDLSAEKMLQLIREIQKSEAKEIIPIYLSNIFDYESPQTSALVEFVQKDKRITVATLGLNFRSPFFIEFPTQLAPIMERVRGIETFKARSTDIVRDIPFYSYRGITRVAQLPLYLADKSETKFNSNMASYRLNYLRPSQFTEIPAENVLANSIPISVFANQIVLLGYKVYRKWPAQTYDPMLVNTPLRGSPNSFMDGEAIIYVTANALDNLLNNRFLIQAPLWLTILHTALVTLVFLIVWKFGPIVGSILTMATFVLLIQCHSLIFEFLRIQIPFSDTFIFSSFAVILGVVGNLRNVIQKYADIRARVNADQELDRLRGRFLDQFANGVSSLNADLLKQVKSIAMYDDLTTIENKLVNAAIDSGYEFEEFLNGIKQLASTSGDNKLTNPVISEFRLFELVNKVLGRFDDAAGSKNIQIVVNIPVELHLHTSQEILDTILFNLISNAIKYSPTGSTVRIYSQSLEKITRISVADEGPGIPEELRERIFEKFYRIKNDDVYKIKGTGIGLFLTRFFAGRINASIAVESNHNQGAVFNVDIRS